TKLPAVPIADLRDPGRVHDEGSGETDARVEIGRGDADAGSGGGKGPFGLPDIRPPPQQVRGQTNRHGRSRNGNRPSDDKLIVQNVRLLSQQYSDVEDRLVDVALERGNGCFGRSHVRRGAAHVQVAHSACSAASAHEI